MAVAPVLDLAEEIRQDRVDLHLSDAFDLHRVFHTQRPLFRQLAQHLVSENHVRRTMSLFSQPRPELTQTVEKEVFFRPGTCGLAEFFLFRFFRFFAAVAGELGKGQLQFARGRQEIFAPAGNAETGIFGIAAALQQTLFQQVDVRFRQDGLVLTAADRQDRDFRLRDCRTRRTRRTSSRNPSCRLRLESCVLQLVTCDLCLITFFIFS